MEKARWLRNGKFQYTLDLDEAVIIFKYEQDYVQETIPSPWDGFQVQSVGFEHLKRVASIKLVYEKDKKEDDNNYELVEYDASEGELATEIRIFGPKSVEGDKGEKIRQNVPVPGIIENSAQILGAKGLSRKASGLINLIIKALKEDSRF